MLEKLFALIETLLMLDEDPKSNRRWRMTVALISIIFMIHILWACGYGERIGLSGFVKAGDLSELKGQVQTATTFVQQMQLRALTKQMLDTRTQQCSSTTKKYFTQRLSELRADYYRATGHDWDVPNCAELE